MCSQKYCHTQTSVSLIEMLFDMEESSFYLVNSEDSEGSGEDVTLISDLQGPLVRWLKVNFSEAFIAWIHIKALRVFVESVLRSRSHTVTADELLLQLVKGFWILRVFFQIRAAGELPGHAPAAKQEDHEEAEGGAQRALQTPGQQRGSHH